MKLEFLQTVKSTYFSHIGHVESHLLLKKDSFIFVNTFNLPQNALLIVRPRIVHVPHIASSFRNTCFAESSYINAFF